MESQIAMLEKRVEELEATLKKQTKLFEMILSYVKLDTEDKRKMNERIDSIQNKQWSENDRVI